MRRLLQIAALFGILAIVIIQGGFAARPHSFRTLSEFDRDAPRKSADLSSCEAAQDPGLEGWLCYFAEVAVTGPREPPVRAKDAIPPFYAKVFARQNLDFQW